jgi:hypothetical protein
MYVGRFFRMELFLFLILLRPDSSSFLSWQTDQMTLVSLGTVAGITLPLWRRSDSRGPDFHGFLPGFARFFYRICTFVFPGCAQFCTRI